MTALSKLMVGMACALLIAGIHGFTAPASAETAKENGTEPPIVTEAAPAKVKTPEQALETAKAFFRQVNWAFDDSPAETDVIAMEKHKISGVDEWKVEIGKCYARIDPNSAQIVAASYSVDPYVQKGATRTMVLDKEKAVVLARKYLSLAGVTLEESELAVARNEPYVLGVSTGYTEWQVHLRRQYSGYLFGNDWAQVNMDPYDGSLIHFSYSFRMPLPDSFELKINQVEAEEIVRTYLDEHKRALGNLLGTSLEIVWPSKYWQAYFIWEATDVDKRADLDLKSFKDQKIKTRLAWVIRGDGPKHPVVFVDTITGEIIGGLQSM